LTLSQALKIVLIGVCSVLTSAAAYAQADAPRCAAPSELSAKPGEERPVKGNHRFDAPETARTLAAFSPLPAHLRGAIRRVELPKGRKLVALTFDLCEQPGEIAGYDGAIFDYLRANGIKATLFTGGKWMRSHPERFAQILTDPLFEMANHGAAHRNLRLLSGAALAAEIAGPQRAYEAIRSTLADSSSPNQCLAQAAVRAPARMSLFRFPYGACNGPAMAAVNDAGLLAIQWDVSTGDPSPGTTAQQIAAAMVQNVRPGSIVISHANGRGYHTAAGLPLAIPKLIAAGYQFVTVSELLAAGTPVVVPTCYNAKVGDTDRYDHPLGLTAKLSGRPKASTAPGAGAALLPWQTVMKPARPVQPVMPRAAPGHEREQLPWQ